MQRLTSVGLIRTVIEVTQIDIFQTQIIDLSEKLNLAREYQSQLEHELRDLRLTTEKYQISAQGQIEAYAKQAIQQENQIHALQSANNLLKEELNVIKTDNMTLLKENEKIKKIPQVLQKQINDLKEKHRLENDQVKNYMKKSIESI